MATSKNNIVTDSLSGRIGNVIFKDYGDKTVMSKCPDMSKVIKTEKQLDNQYNFKVAQAYAKKLINDPVKKAELTKTLKEGQKAYHAAISKYLKQIKIADLARTENQWLMTRVWSFTKLPYWK